MRGPAAWDTEPTIRRAIEIHDGQPRAWRPPCRIRRDLIADGARAAQ